VLYRADHGDGLTFSFLYANAYLRMRDQTMGFQHFRYLLFRLDLRQASDMQADGNQGDTDGSRLANAHFPAKFFYIKDLDIDDIPVADYVVVRRQACRRGKRADAVIGLLRRFENGLLCAAGRRQNHHPKQGSRNETPHHSTQTCWLHENGLTPT